MPTTSTLAAFVVASLVLLVVPGPAVLYIVARSGAQGVRAGLVAVGGVHTASAIHVLAAVAGLSAIVVASASAFTAVKWVGGAYLIVLGARTILAARRPVAPAGPGPRPHGRLFVESFVVNLLNPKVALFFLAFLPQFVDPNRGPVWLQTILLGGIYIVVGTVSDGVYAVVGGSAGRWLLARRAVDPAPRRPAPRTVAPHVIEGGVLILLGVATLAVPHRRT